MKLYHVTARSRSGMIAGSAVELADNEEHAKDILADTLAKHAGTSKKAIREHFRLTVTDVEAQLGRRITIEEPATQVVQDG